jgi:hypothetical protein
VEIFAYCLGIGFLLACAVGVPLLRKMAHERTLKGLGMEGLTVVPRLWSLSGLRIDRPAWKAEVVFESARPGGGRPGHLRLRADFSKPAPPLAFPARPSREDAVIHTGDEAFDRKIVVEGDPSFAKKFLVPEMRELLMQLDQLGGRVLAIGEGTIEIDGPLLGEPPALRQFLELCDDIVDGTVAAAGG